MSHGFPEAGWGGDRVGHGGGGSDCVVPVRVVNTQTPWTFYAKLSTPMLRQRLLTLEQEIKDTSCPKAEGKAQVIRDILAKRRDA